MNEEYIDNVKHLIEQKDADKVKGLLIDLHPADIAELCNDLNPEEAKFVYRLLNNETAADVLVEMDEDARKELLDMLPSETIAKRFVDYMDTDDAVDLMRELDEDKQEEILSHIEDIEQAGDIVDLLKYDENTAGGLMGTEMVLVNENWSMPECLKEMRQQAEELDEIYRSKYDYRKFLKQFCRLREEVELDTESFDYIFYSFGMEHYGNIPLIEPLEYKEVNRLEELVIAIDTSGSCSRETVQRFLGETYGILSEKENFFSRMKVYIVQCDCFIQKVDVIHSEEEWREYSRNVKIQGRGGTDFRPVFELIRQEKERKELKNLRALIYFTDGDGIYPGQKPDYETAFVFLKRTDKMKLVPPWAKCLITGMGQTAEQMSV